MKEIELTQKKVTLVDDEDFGYLNLYSWQINKVGKNNYARRSVWVDGKKINIYMHRVVLGCPPR